jgi:hypothetical protein
MKVFHKKPDKNIIQNNANQNQEEIPEKLYPPVKNGSGKYHVTHKHETGGETDKEGYDESCDMGFERDETQMQNFFMQNIIIGQEKHQNIENRVGASANSISEGLK